MKRAFAAAITAAFLVVPAVAQADLKTDAVHLRTRVVHRFGRRAPGRDIVKWGVKTHRGYRTATKVELTRYVSTLRRMLYPPVVQTVTHSSYASSNYAAGGIVGCILQRESTNGAASSNLAQFQQSTWDAYGGRQYASSPGAASRADQIAMVNKVLAAGGIGNWRPYDGC